MKFLLDTTVISELRRPERAAVGVRGWMGARTDGELFCSCVSILELEIGAPRALRRNAPQGGMLRDWIDNQVLPSFKDRIIPLDTETALRCAALHVPTTRPERDAWIAATALVHGMAVVTRNVRDFEPMGVAVVNPWEQA